MCCYWKEELEREKQEIFSGQDVFTGTIYDNEGNKRCDSSESISDNILLRVMNWLVEGIREYED